MKKLYVALLLLYLTPLINTAPQNKEAEETNQKTIKIHNGITKQKTAAQKMKEMREKLLSKLKKNKKKKENLHSRLFKEIKPEQEINKLSAKIKTINLKKLAQSKMDIEKENNN